MAAAWAGIRHLPETAQAEVVRVARRGEVQGVAFDGRSLPMAILRGAVTTKVGDVADAVKLVRDRDALIAALVAHGYLAARVSDARVVNTDGGAAFVTFAIDQGPLFRVRSVTVSGASARDAGVVGLVAGEVALADRIAAATEAVADRLTARGQRSTVAASLATDPAGFVDIELVADR
jgi:outer membrane protein assembly factor BamA